jgi:hypothetical protein
MLGAMPPRDAPRSSRSTGPGRAGAATAGDAETDWRRYHTLLSPDVWPTFEAMAREQLRSPHQQIALAVREQLERWERERRHPRDQAAVVLEHARAAPPDAPPDPPPAGAPAGPPGRGESREAAARGAGTQSHGRA